MRTRTAEFYSVDYRNLLILATMGLSIIAQSLKDSAYFYTGTGGTNNRENTSKIATQALAFIQGSGLEITIQQFGLDLNANLIRMEFNRIFHA